MVTGIFSQHYSGSELSKECLFAIVYINRTYSLIWRPDFALSFVPAVITEDPVWPLGHRAVVISFSFAPVGHWATGHTLLSVFPG